jgi:hypothetical protein
VTDISTHPDWSATRRILYAPFKLISDLFHHLSASSPPSQATMAIFISHRMLLRKLEEIKYPLNEREKMKPHRPMKESMVGLLGDSEIPSEFAAELPWAFNVFAETLWKFYELQNLGDGGLEWE